MLHAALKSCKRRSWACLAFLHGREGKSHGGRGQQRSQGVWRGSRRSAHPNQLRSEVTAMRLAYAGRSASEWGAEDARQASSEAGAWRPSALSDKRSGVIARWSAILLSGTAAIALSIAQPASAIVINDQVAAAVGGIGNYSDAGNQFRNVVSLFSASLFSAAGFGSFCTGSLINSRTIATAAHCFAPNDRLSISFAPIAGPGTGITSYVRNPSWTDPINDIAVISLAQPVTNVAPVKLLTLQPGQPG